MTLGYDTRYCNATAVACAATAASPLYDSESHRPQAELQLRPSMLLGARTLDAAQDEAIRKDVAAQLKR